MSSKRFRKLLPFVVAFALLVPLFFVLATPASADDIDVSKDDPAGCSDITGDPYCTIQAAVDAAGDGDTVRVYPATTAYEESVDLYKVGGGSITLLAMGALTVDGDTGPAFHTSSKHSGDVTIDGFVVNSTGDDGIYLDIDGEVVIRNVTANGTGNDGIRVYTATGDVSIGDCIARDNDGHGIYVGDRRLGGSVTITNCAANDNGVDGIEVANVGGQDVIITDCTINGNGTHGIELYDVQNMTIRNCTANDSGSVGIHVEELAEGGIIENCTAIGNSIGIQFYVVSGWLGPSWKDLIVANCIAADNDIGINAFHVGGVFFTIEGNIICGNSSDGLVMNSPGFDAGAEGNWWGCSAGPADAACDSVNELDGTADFTPWIDTITASGPASVMIGEPAVVSFQFSGGAETVFLGEGPGDLRGPPPFILTTDNGVLIDSDETGAIVREFINNPDGVLSVTLVPGFGGAATVWLDGPCGLDAVWIVEAWEFVPEPGSAVLLASGLMGMAGYATLRWRAKK
jgi:parallel beta-helix repeat protein